MMKTLGKKFDKLFDHILDDMETSRREQGDSKVTTMVGRLLDQLEDPYLEYKCTKKHIKAVIQVLVLPIIQKKKNTFLNSLIT